MWSIWALLPGHDSSTSSRDGAGWSRIAAGLTQENAEQFAASLLFQGRAMAEKEEER